MILSLKNVGYRVKDKDIISNFSLDIATGAFLTIVGPSGGGKSTLLKLLANLKIKILMHTHQQIIGAKYHIVFNSQVFLEKLLKTIWSFHLKLESKPLIKVKWSRY